MPYFAQSFAGTSSGQQLCISNCAGQLRWILLLVTRHARGFQQWWLSLSSHRGQEDARLGQIVGASDSLGLRATGSDFRKPLPWSVLSQIMQSSQRHYFPIFAGLCSTLLDISSWSAVDYAVFCSIFAGASTKKISRSLQPGFDFRKPLPWSVLSQLWHQLRFQNGKAEKVVFFTNFGL